jgi:DUF1365 family protein
LIQEGIYSGNIWHQRFIPIQHRFRYTQLMIAIDLDNISQHCFPNTMLRYNAFGLLNLRDRDHFAQTPQNLKANIANLLPQHIQQKPHRIFLLTQLAHLGFSFNPISFFVIKAKEHDQILGLVLEVHNTPWGERHYYPVFDLQDHLGILQARFKKELHVSPFMNMNFDYVISLSKKNNTTNITMDNWRDNTKHFSAGLSMHHQPLEAKILRQQFIRHLFSPHKTVAAIYWQALKLWLKGVPFCAHPKTDVNK